MRYMLMRKADTDTENAVLPTEEILQAMADYNERMLLAGYSVLEADSLEDFEPGSALEKHRSMGNLPREMNVHVAFHS